MTQNTIDQIESLISTDIGKRGITPLAQATKGSLQAAARELFRDDVRNVAIITGFSIPPGETDGPPGAYSIGKALHALGKHVVFVTDEENESVVRHCIVHGSLSSADVAVFPTDRSQGDRIAQKLFDQYDFDCLLSIERVGENPEGKCLTMKARDVSDRHGRVEALYTNIPLNKNVVTIGIGDGGNEIGMGTVSELVKQHIPRGEQIQCAISVQHLIVAGVSNWGGHALAAILFGFAVSSDSSSKQFHKDQIHEVVVSAEEEAAAVQRCVEAGGIDGVLGRGEVSVDGFDVAKHHSPLLRRIIEIVLS
eukprot:gb/GECH01013158.1/.p1 GENE.gb/GECH01013158.1/~~gb/GECH01013158.1/.p1  ORF type:complete len:308 (+),score=92.81 gb/GECH01013158.1/:1-924(+)